MKMKTNWLLAPIVGGLTIVLLTGGLLSNLLEVSAQADEAVPTTAARSTEGAKLGLVSQRPDEGPYVETPHGFMVPYTATIPGSDVTFEMVPVPGGEFLLGSSEGEQDSAETDLPSRRVSLPPFWIARHEVTWAEYWKYMELNDHFAKLEALRTALNSDDANQRQRRDLAEQVVADKPRIAEAVADQPEDVDGVTAPTPLYDPSSTYESGKDPRQPAVSMTPYAARQYTKWLSLTSGVDYRLPTEAEWEYAARAGSTTVYPFGDDPEELDQYAWFGDNSDGSTQRVGQKKPNAWGLYDMLGNVAEWVVDEYLEEPPTVAADKVLSWEEAIEWPTQSTHRLARGGHWDSEAGECRSASRIYSEDEDWKGSDPNFPLSPWWYTDYPARGVGLRIVRPLEPLSPELARKFWEIDHEDIASDVNERLKIGKGRIGEVNRELPKLQQDLGDERVQKLIEVK